MSALLILSAGSFGRAVGEFISARAPSARLAAMPADVTAIDGLIDGAAFVAVAAWRPYHAAFEHIDDLCFDRRLGWSLAELHGQRLTLGPCVVPGAGACYHCYRQRWNVHHPAPDRELVLEEAYARNPDMGPAGFIAPLVAIAGAALLQDAAGGAAAAGRLRLVDVLTGSMLATEVIGVHGCPRCRPRPAGPAGARFVDRLVPAIEEVMA